MRAKARRTVGELGPYAIVAGLVLLNGLFVGAEFALVAAPRTSLERKAAGGHRTARLVVDILRRPVRQDRFYATSQLGITVASLGLGMYGEHVFAGVIAGWLEALGATRWVAAHALASALSVTALTYLHVVVGEVVPKSLCLQYAGRLVVWVVPVMVVVQTLLYPVIVVLHALASGVLRLVGIRRQASTDRFYTAEELQFIVEESEEGGLLKAGAGRMLAEIFDFGDLTAGQVMAPRVRVAGLPVGAAAPALRAALRAAPHTRYPVYDGDLDHVLGVVHVKNLLPRLLAGEPLSHAVIRPLPVVPETMRLDDVLLAMRKAPAQMAVVIDEHGGTAGILTLEDLFEEVVGEIDESLGPRVPLRDSRGRQRVKGTLRLDELGQLFGIELSHEDVDSVSGLVLTILGRPPAIGDVVDYGGLRIEVTAVQGRGVREAAVDIAE
jgi:CBS domain containing-hemolysin-like protein